MAVIPTPEGYATHKALMIKFLKYLNASTDAFVLKGGTSLYLCYNLNRFSEDIDLDAINKAKDILPYIKRFCADNNLACRVAKDTKTVKRCIVHYTLSNGADATLKIETSYRNSYPYVTKKDNILVYTVECLAILKTTALLNRDKIRDIYDVLFIYSNYKTELSLATKMQIQSALIAKGSEAIIEIISSQSDPLINKTLLEDTYMAVCSDLGITL